MLIAWQNTVFFRLVTSRKPEAMIACYAYHYVTEVGVMNFNGLEWRTSTDPLAWLEKKGVKYTKQSFHAQLEKIRDEYKTFREGVTKTVNKNAEIAGDEIKYHPVHGSYITPHQQDMRPSDEIAM